MNPKSKQNLSFKTLIELLALLPYRIYHVIMFFLILICSLCNYSSRHTLPMFWVLVAGFVTIIYLDIYSIKKTYNFSKNMSQIMSDDNALSFAHKKLEKRMYSNRNWFIILVLPICILPFVIYIIRCPLGISIKIFAYTALYIIIALCLIGYIQYVNLIRLTHDCSKEANHIIKYDKNRPYKTEWIVKLASLTNKQSNLFFFVGSDFILLLYLITFTDFFSVQLDVCIIKKIVIYLWGIIIIAIVIMFPVFSLYSYLSIKNLISQLVEQEINNCSILLDLNTKKNKEHLKVLQAINQIKIIMLDKTPVYPEKPLVVYAISYIIAIINFVAAVQATISLIEYIP